MRRTATNAEASPGELTAAPRPLALDRIEPGAGREIAARIPDADAAMVNVWIALRHVFGPVEFRAIVEAWDEAAHRPAGDDSESAIPAADTPSEPPLPVAEWLRIVRPGTALGTVVGFTDARRRLEQSHWVVAIVEASSLRDGPSEHVLNRLRDVSARLLLIVLDAPDCANEIYERALTLRAIAAKPSREPELESFGIPLGRPVDSHRVDELVREFEQIKELEEPTIIRVRSSRAPRSVSDVARSTAAGSVKTRDAGRRTAALARVVLRTAEADPRLLFVEMAEPRGVMRPLLEAPLGDRFFEVDGLERNSGLVWCGALAAGGCRPVVLMSDSFLRRQFEQVSNEICARRLPVVLVVDEREPERGESRGGGKDATSAAAQARLLPNVRVFVPRGEGDLGTMLGEALAADGPSVLVVPRDGQTDRAGLPLFGYTRESLERERDLVVARTLSPDLQRWVEIYERVGSRKRYLWQWALQGAELTTLPCVLPEWKAHVADTKVLSIIICVLLDDVADQRGTEGLLEHLLRIASNQAGSPSDSLSPEEAAYSAVTQELHACLRRRVEEYPLCEMFHDLLAYDSMQYLNTMRYSHLINRRPSLLNVAEHDLYLPHNMHMMSFATLDLMCSPSFECQELGKLREVVWHAQCMGRIANLLSTWRREIGQGDFTGGVFARAVLEDDLTLEQLSAGDRTAIEAVIRGGGHEDYYLRRWHEHHESFRNVAQRVRSVDLDAVLKSHERFFRMHLGSRGLI